jgi:protein tyrosine/serine phosphatase
VQLAAAWLAWPGCGLYLRRFRQLSGFPLGYREKHFDLDTEAGRKAAWRDYWWNDHAFLREHFQNAHQISPRMWRTNQPSPEQLRRWRDDHGVRTVINLRGDTAASFTALEKRACRDLGLDLHFLKIESRGAPDPVLLKEAREIFGSIAYPALMHCKSGADRAGVMSVFYMHLVEGVPLEEARRQLSNKYLHISAGKTGILGFFWDEYARAHAESGIDFWVWLDTAYDREDLRARYKPTPVGDWLVDRVLGRE